MRRLLLALMIVMLPLRGWLGDAMAMELVAPAMQAVAAVADAPAAHAAHAGQAAQPCHETAAAMPAGAHDSTQHASGNGHGHCTACQICHSVAAADGVALPASGALRHAAPHMAAPRFASAEPRRVAEPPIS